VKFLLNTETIANHSTTEIISNHSLTELPNDFGLSLETFNTILVVLVQDSIIESVRIQKVKYYFKVKVLCLIDEQTIEANSSYIERSAKVKGLIG